MYKALMFIVVAGSCGMLAVACGGIQPLAPNSGTQHDTSAPGIAGSCCDNNNPCQSGLTCSGNVCTQIIDQEAQKINQNDYCPASTGTGSTTCPGNLDMGTMDMPKMDLGTMDMPKMDLGGSGTGGGTCSAGGVGAQGGLCPSNTSLEGDGCCYPTYPGNCNDSDLSLCGGYCPTGTQCLSNQLNQTGCSCSSGAAYNCAVPGGFEGCV